MSAFGKCAKYCAWSILMFLIFTYLRMLFLFAIERSVGDYEPKNVMLTGGAGFM